MIRLVALACGLLCGIGMVWSELFRPSLLSDIATLVGPRDPTLGLGLLSALGVSVIILALTRRLSRPLFGGEMQPVETGGGWRAVVGGLLFGLGWGLAGYFPLGAFVSIGLFAPGAAIFLASVLGGMILHDLVASRDRRAGRPTGFFG